ncbi:MAG: PEP-CTERM sorting domain-containing protein [Candidatus Thiodiazotropha sp.]
MFNQQSFSKLFLAPIFVGALSFSLPLNAGVLGFWAADGWSTLDSEDGVGSGGYVGPGWGGQSFDAEYLFYKQDGNLLSIGLQSGFDLVNGEQAYADHEYFAGDLALAFNGGAYDYAVDFGFETKDIDGVNAGGAPDAEGLYSVSSWNNNISFAVSSPFAMDSGSLLTGVTSTSGFATLVDGTSYFRTATFDLAALGFETNSFSAHWTMSCGNDVVEGSADVATDVPEPATLLLMAGGLFGLFGGRRLRRRA